MAVKLDSAYDPMTIIERKGSPKKRNGLLLSFAWYHNVNSDCLCRLRVNVLDIGTQQRESLPFYGCRKTTFTVFTTFTFVFIWKMGLFFFFTHHIRVHLEGI